MDGFEMRDIHRMILVRSRTYLLHNLRPTETFWSALMAKDIFSEDMVDDIKSMRLRSEQIGKMLDLLPARGPSAFDLFIETLLECDHSHVAEYLKTMEATDNFRKEVTRHCTVVDCMVENVVNIYKHSTPIIKRFTEQRFELLLQEQAKELEEQDKTYRELEASFGELHLENMQLQDFARICHDVSDDVRRELQKEFVSKSFLRDTSAYFDKLKDQMQNAPGSERMIDFYSNMQVMLAYIEKLSSRGMAEYKPAAGRQRRSGRPQSALRRLGSAGGGDGASLNGKMQRAIKIVGAVLHTIGDRTQVAAGLIRPDLDEVLALMREVMDDICYTKDVFKTTLRQKRRLEGELVSAVHNWQEVRRLEREVKEKQGHIVELNRESQVLKRKSRGQQQRKHLNQIHLNLEQKRMQLRELQTKLERNLGSADVRLHSLLKLLPDLADDDGRSDTDLSGTTSTATSSRTSTPRPRHTDDELGVIKETDAEPTEGPATMDKGEGSTGKVKPAIPAAVKNGTSANAEKPTGCLLERRFQKQHQAVVRLSNPNSKSRDFRPRSQDKRATARYVPRIQENGRGINNSNVRCSTEKENKGQSPERKGNCPEKEANKAEMNPIDEWIEQQKKQTRTSEIRKKLDDFKIEETKDKAKEMLIKSVLETSEKVCDGKEPVKNKAKGEVSTTDVEGRNQEKVNTRDVEWSNQEKVNTRDVEWSNQEKVNTRDVEWRNQQTTGKEMKTEHGQTENNESQSVPTSGSCSRSLSAESVTARDGAAQRLVNDVSGQAIDRGGQSGSRKNSSGTDGSHGRTSKASEAENKPVLSTSEFGVKGFGKEKANVCSAAINDTGVDASLRRGANQGQRQALSTTKVNLTLPGT